MTRYALDPTDQALVAVWSVGVGERMQPVGELPQHCGLSRSYALAASLTQLSNLAWSTYSRPATELSCGCSHDVERSAFAKVPSALRSPPREDVLSGEFSVSHLERAAYSVGRLLEEIGDNKLATDVWLEVCADLTSVESAERGDLSGRSQQAVALSHLDPSPLQIAAAHELLTTELFRPQNLFCDVDPVAACVASAEWLRASVAVACESAGCRRDDVFSTAARQGFASAPAAMLVLELLQDGHDALDLVTSLIAEAASVATGRVFDLSDLVSRVAVAISLGAQNGRPSSDLFTRLTAINPQAPATSLLEQLLQGVGSCFRIYACATLAPSGDSVEGLMKFAASRDRVALEQKFTTEVSSRVRQLAELEY